MVAGPRSQLKQGLSGITAKALFCCVRKVSEIDSFKSGLARPRNWQLQLFGSKRWAAMLGQEQAILSMLDGSRTRTRFDAADTLDAELQAFARAMRQ